VTSTLNVNGTQFHAFTGGPEEAKMGHLDSFLKGHGNEGGFEGLLGHPHERGRLFDAESIPNPAAHHQTPERFAQDPKTWWHGRVVTDSPKSRLGGGQGSEGFHAGTQAAARQRLGHNLKRRGLAENKVGRMFPLRVTGPVEGPENIKSDMNKHVELGPQRYGSWGGSSYGGRSTGYLYKNDVEDAGSISVGVPQRKGFMATHKEMVTQAKARGEYVHPLIDWAAKKAPEHTGEAVRGRWGQRTEPQGSQQGLHEQFDKGDSYGKGADPRRLSSFLELHPDRTDTHRTQYTTEGGQRKGAFAFSTEQPGSGLLSKQWQPMS